MRQTGYLVAVGLSTAMLAAGCATGERSESAEQEASQSQPQKPQGRDTSEIASSFDLFCDKWMRKLDTREQRNLKHAQVRNRGKAFVVEYTGYSHQPVSCEAKPSRASKGAYVGKLVYDELHYRKTAKTAARARNSKPRIVQQIEVLEIFRFDGSRWIY
jgi:outer membrane biogenesis lipoprotein LolB